MYQYLFYKTYWTHRHYWHKSDWLDHSMQFGIKPPILKHHPLFLATPTLKVTKLLVKNFQFQFLVMTEKNIFVYKLFLSLNISNFSLFFMWKFQPPPLWRRSSPMKTIYLRLFLIWEVFIRKMLQLPIIYDSRPRVLNCFFFSQ